MINFLLVAESAIRGGLDPRPHPGWDDLVSVAAVKSAFGVASDSLRSPLTAVPATKIGLVIG
jgi:hypothetical protein